MGDTPHSRIFEYIDANFNSPPPSSTDSILSYNTYIDEIIDLVNNDEVRTTVKGHIDSIMVLMEQYHVKPIHVLVGIWILLGCPEPWTRQEFERDIFPKPFTEIYALNLKQKDFTFKQYLPRETLGQFAASLYPGHLISDIMGRLAYFLPDDFPSYDDCIQQIEISIVQNSLAQNVAMLCYILLRVMKSTIVKTIGLGFKAIWHSLLFIIRIPYKLAHIMIPAEVDAIKRLHLLNPLNAWSISEYFSSVGSFLFQYLFDFRNLIVYPYFGYHIFPPLPFKIGYIPLALFTDAFVINTPIYIIKRMLGYPHEAHFTMSHLCSWFVKSIQSSIQFVYDSLESIFQPIMLINLFPQLVYSHWLRVEHLASIMEQVVETDIELDVITHDQQHLLTMLRTLREQSQAQLNTYNTTSLSQVSAAQIVTSTTTPSIITLSTDPHDHNSITTDHSSTNDQQQQQLSPQSDRKQEILKQRQLLDDRKKRALNKARRLYNQLDMEAPSLYYAIASAKRLVDTAIKSVKHAVSEAWDEFDKFTVTHHSMTQQQQQQQQQQEPSIDELLSLSQQQQGDDDANKHSDTNDNNSNDNNTSNSNHDHQQRATAIHSMASSVLSSTTAAATASTSLFQRALTLLRSIPSAVSKALTRTVVFGFRFAARSIFTLGHATVHLAIKLIKSIPSFIWWSIKAVFRSIYYVLKGIGRVIFSCIKALFNIIKIPFLFAFEICIAIPLRFIHRMYLFLTYQQHFARSLFNLVPHVSSRTKRILNIFLYPFTLLCIVVHTFFNNTTYFFLTLPLTMIARLVIKALRLCLSLLARLDPYLQQYIWDIIEVCYARIVSLMPIIGILIPLPDVMGTYKQVRYEFDKFLYRIGPENLFLPVAQLFTNIINIFTYNGTLFTRIFHRLYQIRQYIIKLLQIDFLFPYAMQLLSLIDICSTFVLKTTSTGYRFIRVSLKRVYILLAGGLHAISPSISSLVSYLFDINTNFERLAYILNQYNLLSTIVLSPSSIIPGSKQQQTYDFVETHAPWAANLPVLRPLYWDHDRTNSMASYKPSPLKDMGGTSYFASAAQAMAAVPSLEAHLRRYLPYFSYYPPTTAFLEFMNHRKTLTSQIYNPIMRELPEFWGETAPQEPAAFIRSFFHCLDHRLQQIIRRAKHHVIPDTNPFTFTTTVFKTCVACGITQSITIEQQTVLTLSLFECSEFIPLKGLIEQTALPTQRPDVDCPTCTLIAKIEHGHNLANLLRTTILNRYTKAYLAAQQQLPIDPATGVPPEPVAFQNYSYGRSEPLNAYMDDSVYNVIFSNRYSFQHETYAQSLIRVLYETDQLQRQLLTMINPRYCEMLLNEQIRQREIMDEIYNTNRAHYRLPMSLVTYIRFQNQCLTNLVTTREYDAIGQKDTTTRPSKGTSSSIRDLRQGGIHGDKKPATDKEKAGSLVPFHPVSAVQDYKSPSGGDSTPFGAFPAPTSAAAAQPPIPTSQTVSIEDLVIIFIDIDSNGGVSSRIRFLDPETVAFTTGRIPYSEPTTIEEIRVNLHAKAGVIPPFIKEIIPNIPHYDFYISRIPHDVEPTIKDVKRTATYEEQTLISSLPMVFTFHFDRLKNPSGDPYVAFPVILDVSTLLPGFKNKASTRPLGLNTVNMNLYRHAKPKPPNPNEENPAAANLPSEAALARRLPYLLPPKLTDAMHDGNTFMYALMAVITHFPDPQGQSAGTFLTYRRVLPSLKLDSHGRHRVYDVNTTQVNEYHPHQGKQGQQGKDQKNRKGQKISSTMIVPPPSQYDIPPVMNMNALMKILKRGVGLREAFMFDPNTGRQRTTKERIEAIEKQYLSKSQWYMCNDDVISISTEKSVLSTKPYMLFYERI